MSLSTSAQGLSHTNLAERKPTKSVLDGILYNSRQEQAQASAAAKLDDSSSIASYSSRSGLLSKFSRNKSEKAPKVKTPREKPQLPSTAGFSFPVGHL